MNSKKNPKNLKMSADMHCGLGQPGFDRFQDEDSGAYLPVWWPGVDAPPTQCLAQVALSEGD